MGSSVLGPNSFVIVNILTKKFYRKKLPGVIVGSGTLGPTTGDQFSLLECSYEIVVFRNPQIFLKNCFLLARVG